MNFRRYAIYHVPCGNSALYQFGASWLGWDCLRGVPCAHPQIANLDIAHITARPRRYGFHATLKAPFALAPHQTQGALTQAFRDFAACNSPIEIGPLKPVRMGKILALAPTGNTSALNALAAQLVQALDIFRAPLTDAARARHSRLNPAQIDNLNKWGYPYVMDEFSFHITLTGAVKNPNQILNFIMPYLDKSALHCYQLSSLSLLGEDESGFFREVERAKLTAPPI